MSDKRKKYGLASASALTAVQIKMEGQENPETISDIQNYLETFNKEIQGGEQTVQHVTAEVVTTEENAEEGTYFVDQSGHYYYQANGDQQPVMTVVSETSAEVTDGASEATYVTMPQESTHVEETITGLESSQEAVTANGADTSMILNTTDTYQTVTIVPSDTNPGEVSYVLIVQQPDEKDDKTDDQDLTVYDFDEGEEGGIAMESGDEDDKTKIIKILPKKSQTVTQAHMCNYCNYTSPKRYLLSRHMKSHSEERPHKCSVCERGFKTLASLQNHVNTHTGTKPHRCKFCDSAFTTSGELVRHVRYRHTHEKPHKCSICDYASVELSKMRNHMRCHTGERPYQCPHCTYASPDTFKLKRHLRIHTGEKPYECDICHARFTQSNSLKAHKLIHSAGDKPVFQCELCPTTCGRKTDLRIHVQKLHTSDKPLKCKRCGKSFPDRYTYKIHNKSHEGEKCFKCDLCPYASISHRHLESHMLIHTDQKPYQCDQCDQNGEKINLCLQSFRQKQLLRRHQNLYHNPNYVPPPPREKTHECPECGRPFRHKGNLIRHMAVHDPESSAQEKALALKLGRQKKIQIIDGQQVEVMAGEDEDEDDEDSESEMMAVEGQDGQQYVVLEVIQLQDGDGDDQTVAVVTGDPNHIQGHNVGIHAGDSDDEGILSTQHIATESSLTDDEDVIHTLQGSRKLSRKDALAIRKRIESEKDVQTCFGFDDEPDGEDDDDDNTKTTIQLLEAIRQ
ncbi:transcriptional repressor CTCFL isoform X2 [Schistocerca americana]|uniref:transcriptional repressor CTCFL isoform X2 n=1 Tax=Schistocerca americana TaxID=7009 RepID=UPI001F4F7C3D|nr:transcriptional repressor CTCFL isoform X2 [Schistocerca americana]XP_047116501.1 transcriptional repressor CTCFL isoform X2 [Schistocerca piceifrons]